VGRSSGAWDEGRGEQDDVRAALAHLRALLGRSDGVALAGYSFGAAMAMAVVRGGEPVAGLALIAPPLASAAWDAPAPPAVDGPTLVVAGSEDTHCPPGALAALGAGMPRTTVRVIDRADHFFHSGHAPLVIALTDWAAALAAA
jgi:alpha/beta superfamily hydrolase